MTAAERAHIRHAIDDRARLVLADAPVLRCLLCDAQLPADQFEWHRKFCGDTHRKRWHDAYGRYLAAA